MTPKGRHLRTPTTGEVWRGLRPLQTSPVEYMQQIFKRLSALSYLARPLALAFIGIIFLSFGATYFAIAIYRTSELPALFYYITLQFLERWVRGVIFTITGLAVLLVGIWRLSGVV